ncbi:MAG TPA: TrbI/VirB10 family protein, partial [Gemmatimonadaceae bacterium]|nr:TrbI/VirB10 family protein [Gemmatimonadaceae bacterium]
FLERPAKGTANTAIAGSTTSTPPSNASATTPAVQSAAPSAPIGTQSGYVPAPYSSLSPGIGSAANPQPRDQAFDAALKRSAIGRSDASGTSVEGGTASSAGSLAADEARLVAYGDSVMRSATQPATAATSPAAATNPRRTFMQQAGDLGGRSVVARLEPAGTPYVLRAGTVIPAILLTAITSDLPGDCMGQVSRDVYDSQSQRILLIPKGSKLMCRYDDQVVAGQGRLLVAWTRLMLPDGRSMTLPGLALKDAQGQTGAKGDVDNHTRRVFGKALLLSAIGAGAQLSQPRQVTILASPTTGQVMAGAVGQELSNVALEILRRGMDQPPTITVPQGQTFNVFLNGDLVFDGPYEPSR